ncbi:hypothetical protein [Indioceanicola profundi]|uniref:hypothetical protein n=1 Tax=Indioceanicola profundi TaxID=2220096 RepID=UPI000E6AC1A3|nr:hypothetical protein [Indioceanicola profundi]
MTERSKSGDSPFAEQVRRSPQENARAAEREMSEDEKRREVEQAQANKQEAQKEKRSDTLGSVADVNTAMTSRD